jgi:tRNA threonylcarbamoyladenosine biosynthesis protein TsaE
MGNRPSMQQPRPDPRAWTRFDTPEALEALGARIAGELRAGEALCLYGALGAGKTTLARGLVRALLGAPDAEVPSPTFTLVQTYEAEGLTLSHFDLYRLKRPEEAFELGLDEALDVGAAVIEWSERLEGALPPNRLDLRLTAEPPPGAEHAGDGHSGDGRWGQARGMGRWTAERTEAVMAGAITE